MKKIALILLLFCSTLMSSTLNEFVVDDYTNTYVRNLHYDSDKGLIILNAHGKFLIFEVDEWFGFKVKNKKEADKIIDSLGDSLNVYHLKKIR